MGTSPSTTFPSPRPLLRAKYGPFEDVFMYKYLSHLLASVAHIPAPKSNATMISAAYKNRYSDLEFYDYSSPDSKVSTVIPSSSGSAIDSPIEKLLNDQSDWNFTNESCANCSDTLDYPLPLPQTIAIIFAGTLLSLVTVGGNAMVMASFRLERQLKTISNYFLFSLAVADLAIGLISIPLMTYYTAKGQWDLGYSTCEFWLSIDYLMSNASVMNLLLISFDRYFSVTRPLTYRPRRTSKKAMVMIASTFLISLLLWPPLIIAWPHIEGEFKIPSNECIVQFLRTNPAVTLVTATVAFFGPVVIMIVLYGRVYYVTRIRQRELVKLQAFHQQSIRRTISSNSDARVPLRNTLSTTSSSVLGQRVSSYSRIHRDSGENDLDSMFCNNPSNNNRSSPSGYRSTSRNALQRLESEGKPWGFHALLDHFTRPKPIQSFPSTRQASLASSGFEDEESFSGVSCDTTTHVCSGEEAMPLRRGVQRGEQFIHEPCSPTQSDYGSTLANQFINHVRQSFLINRRKSSRIDLAKALPTSRIRSMSTPHTRQFKLTNMANMLANPQKYQCQQQNQNPRIMQAGVIENTNSYDPANSPLQELRHMSAVARIRAKCAGVTKSAPMPSQIRRLKATSEEDENDLSTSEASSRAETPTRSASTPVGARRASVYNVLIQLGRSGVDRAPPAPPPPKVRIANERRKVSRQRPVITLYNSIGDYARLSPDRATSTVSSFSTADVSSAGVPSVIVRRLSSGSSAVSDPTSPQANASTAFISQSRKQSRSSGVASLASSLRCKGVNRMSSARSTGANSNANATAVITNSVGIGSRSSRRRKKGERRYQESKAARTLSAILLAFVVTWAPYNFIVCIDSFHSGAVPVIWFTFSYYLCYLNSTINPFLYAMCNTTFRRTFWRIMTLKWSSTRRHRHQPHHQAAVALTAVAIAATNNRQQFGTTSSFR